MSEMDFNFSGMDLYLPNSRLQQFKDMINAENMQFKEISDEYSEKKASVGRNIGFTLEGLKTLKNLRDTNIKDTVSQSIADNNIENLAIDRKPFTLPVKRDLSGNYVSNYGDGKYQWKPGSNIKSGYDQVVTPTPVKSSGVEKLPDDVTRGFKYNKDSNIINRPGSTIGKVGQVAGTAMAGISAAKGIKNWDKQGTMGKANTVVNTLSTLSGIAGMAGLSNPLTAPLAIAGLLTSMGASNENKGTGMEYNPYLGSAGGAASWLSQIS